MINLTRNAFLVVALLGGTIGFTSCSSTGTNTTTSANTTTANKNTAVVTNNNSTQTSGTTTNSTTTNTTTKTETASTGDKIGVAECDEYIEKYEACINGKVPEAQRAMFKTQFETIRKSWRDAAATPQGKAALATGCKQATETAKTSMAAFSCNW